MTDGSTGPEGPKAVGGQGGGRVIRQLVKTVLTLAIMSAGSVALKYSSGPFIQQP